jgi:hypothetical protein
VLIDTFLLQTPVTADINGPKTISIKLTVFFDAKE